MVKKYKFLFIALFALLMLLLVPTISKADVAYTRSFPSNDGSIVLNVTGLELSDAKQYEFSIVKKGGTPENWFDITNYNDISANIELKASSKKIAAVLKNTNDGQIFIREKNAETYMVDRLNVNLELPYLIANGITNDTDRSRYGLYGYIYESYGTSYPNLDTVASYQWVKMGSKNETLIKKFLELKNNGGEDYSSLEQYLPTKPTNGYISGNWASYKDKTDGLYVLWIKRFEGDYKDIYFALIYDGLPEATKYNQYIEGADVTAPTVESIQIVSPKSGNYTAGQEVQIRVFFSEKIVATTAPTLKVKVGEGAAQSLTEGVVKNENNKGYITYTYTIKATDKGQIQVTGLTGGNVTDEAENEAVLSCPALTGDNAITANLSEDEQTIAVTGVSIDKTATVQMGKTITLTATVKPTSATNKKVTWKSSDEKIATVDKNGKVTPVKEGTVEIIVTTEDGSKTAKCTLTVTKAATENQKEDDTKKDDTTADKVLPKTGVDMTIVFVIVVVAAGAIVAGVKYNRVRDIK